jgi:CRISPR-associated protein Cmr2
MTAHLLVVTLGPVQDFISQARRTRDLWYGSHLLSELGRAAARALVGGGAELIFPALKKGDPQLEESMAALRPDGTAPLNVANRLLAEIPAGVLPEQLARAVRGAVEAYWRGVAARVKTKCAGLLADGVDDVWTEQIGTVMEFAASWAPLGGYADARRRVERAIAARKSLRDFAQWQCGRGSVYKSSLDGARETVLAHRDRRDPTLVRKYRIADAEQLDAVGLVKRAGGEPDQFVPVVNVALASWVDLAARVAPDELKRLRSAGHEIGLSKVERVDLPCAVQFPRDASVLLRNRWTPLFKELGRDGAESWGRRHVLPLYDRISEPYPYVACLVADGDRMGRAIDRLDTKDKHQKISAALARFAGHARTVVEQEHRGAVIYTGGDDVLAFLPLPEALSCADRLRTCFAKAIESVSPSLAGQTPTLSIGLGIGHVMESMGDLLALGREAERDAKRDRNALAVLVDKRSGDRLSWRAQWDDDPVGRLRESTALLDGRLPSRKIHEIRETLARLPEPAVEEDGRWARLLALEIKRSLLRVEQGSLRLEDVGLVVDDAAGYAVMHGRVQAWISRMLIARTFARAIPRERRGDGVVAA